MRKITALFFRSFLQGILIISPIAVTAYILYKVFYSVDTIIPEMPTGVSFLLVIATITAVGYAGTKLLIGRMLFDTFDYLMQRAPGVKYIYSSIKDILDSFVGDKKRFNEPVWVMTSKDPEMWRIGFMTQKEMAFLGMSGKVAVYLPHSYAVSGWVIIVEASNIKPVTKMNAAEAMKFAVSGGVTSSTEDTPNDTII